MSAPEFIESTNAGREFGYPEHVTDVVFAQFGFQSEGVGNADEFAKTLRELFSLDNGPSKVERCHGFTNGVHEDIFMTYWLSTSSYDQWFYSPPVQRWWLSLPVDGPYGYWREVLSPDLDHLGAIFFGLQNDRLVGITSALGAVPTHQWNYWGGYRDRFKISRSDDLESEWGDGPLGRRHPQTRGRRVRVSVPKNLIFVREGSEPTHMGAEERKLWDEQMKPALDSWVDYLANNPIESGAAVTRNVIEQDVVTGEETEKGSQLVYFLSLRHLERTVRTQPSHTALYNYQIKITGDFLAKGESPALIVWVEAYLLEKGRLDAEYVNCEPDVGLPAWFDSNSTR
jgi:aldoxime dehydratase